MAWRPSPRYTCSTLRQPARFTQSLRGVSPRSGRAHRLHRRTRLRGLRVRLEITFDLRPTARHGVRRVAARPRLHGPATGYECCSAHGLPPCSKPGTAIPSLSLSSKEGTSYERLPASPARARAGDPHPAPLSPLPFDPHRGRPGWAVLSRMFCNDTHKAVRF